MHLIKLLFSHNTKADMLKRVFVLLACFHFFSLTVAGGMPPYKVAGRAGLNVGYGFMDVSALHKFMPPATSSFRNQHLLIGGGAHGFLHGFVIGGSGFRIMRQQVFTDSFVYTVGGGMGTFDFGYLLVNRERFKFYPMIGIGGGSFGIDIARSDNLRLDDVVNKPGNEIKVTNNGFVLDFSLNVDLISAINYNPEQEFYDGFLTGLKIGYLYSLPSSNWNFSGGNISGAPDFSLNMAYVKLVIGGFGFRK